jgi:hypothetical protein
VLFKVSKTFIFDWLPSSDKMLIVFGFGAKAIIGFCCVCVCVCVPTQFCLINVQFISISNDVQWKNNKSDQGVVYGWVDFFLSFVSQTTVSW